MSEGNQTTGSSAQTQSAPAPVQRRCSAIGVLISIIIGVVIGAVLCHQLLKQQGATDVSDYQAFVKTTLQGTGLMMRSAIESMQQYNYGEAKSKLDDVLSLWRRAQQIKDMKSEYPMIDSLVSNLQSAVLAVGSMSADAAQKVDAAANMMKTMNINVGVGSVTPAAPPTPTTPPEATTVPPSPEAPGAPITPPPPPPGPAPVQPPPPAPGPAPAAPPPATTT